MKRSPDRRSSRPLRLGVADLCGDSRGFGRARRGSEGWAARAVDRARTDGRASADKARSRCGRGVRRASTIRTRLRSATVTARVDDARRASGGSHPAEDAHARSRARAAPLQRRVLRRSRSACAAGARMCSATTPWGTGVTATRTGMPLTCCPSATARRSSPVSGWALDSAMLAEQRLELLASGSSGPGRRRRLAPRRHARDADGEPVRVDDRDRPLHVVTML
jgi:hypothetical protein